uniref:DUF3700 domain-containing protein n=1 Tax=Fagus sylvatica TaxID=28930 RepID=A0A2N9G5W8_FAGSY
MINRFSIVFTQAASIDYHHVPLPKIVNSGKFTQHCSPREEGYMRRDFGLAYATPRKSQRGRARSVMLLKLLEGISCQPLQLYGEQVAQVINEGFDAAGHAIGDPTTKEIVVLVLICADLGREPTTNEIEVISKCCIIMRTLMGLIESIELVNSAAVSNPFMPLSPIYSHVVNSLIIRLFAVVDDIFCLFQGHIENVALLKQQYGLNKTANEVVIVIEAYRTLILMEVFPSSGVMILEGHLVLSDDAEIVKKGCGKSFAPFPKGCFFTSFGGLRSFEHLLNEVKPVPRVDSSGQVCGATFTLDAET